MNEKRESWDNYFMGLAEMVSTRATCDRKNVGTIIVKDRRVIASGYNGSIKNLEHCSSPEKYYACKKCGEEFDSIPDFPHALSCAGYGYEEMHGGHIMIDNHCVSGDTTISKFQPGLYNSRHRTIKEIYDMYNGFKSRAGVKLMNIRTMSPNGTIVKGKITDVWCAGNKNTITLKTSLGREVSLTEDHLLYTNNNEWELAGNLSEGVYIALNGQCLADDKDWLYQKYVIEGLTQVQIAEMDGRSRSTIKKRLLDFNIDLREFKLGGWNKGLFGVNSHAFKGEWKYKAGARGWATSHYKNELCSVCGEAGIQQVHHIDKNPMNNSKENLISLCINCHYIAHTPHAKVKRIKFDKIVKITTSGKKDVFDMTTEPYHNFIGNGIILHNCQRTVHSELNALLSAARFGVPLDGSTMYCTTFPCWNCFKSIVSAGIVELIYKEEYGESEDNKLVLAAAKKLETFGAIKLRKL